MCSKIEKLLVCFGRRQSLRLERECGRTVKCRPIAGHASTNRSNVFANLRIGEPTFTLHRPQHQRFPHNKTVVGPFVDHTWQVDLVEMQDPKLIKHNRHTRYLLTVIDVLSKYAWVVGLKRKRGTAGTCWKTSRDNAVPWICRPIRVKNFTTNSCNIYWTSMTSTTIPP